MDVDFWLTLIFILLPLVFAFICFYYAFNYLKRARQLQDIPPSKIRSAVQGHVELSGRTTPIYHEQTIGKLTKMPCAWYNYKIEHLITSPTQEGTSYSWVLLETGVSVDPFLINDGTGECIIFAKGAEIIPTQKFVWFGSTPIPPKLPTTFWQKLFFRNSGAFRFSEERIELDVPIHATGMFYTLTLDDSRIQEVTAVKDYLTQKKVNTVHIISQDGLPKNYAFVVSTIPRSRLILKFKIKAFVFFLAFLFFSSVTASTTYMTVKKTLQQWQSNRH